MAEPLIECRGVTKVFTIGGREVQVLRGIDLAVERGQVAVIAGRSGAGKSTLLSILAGLDPPSAGTVRFDGRDFGAMGRREMADLRRRRIGVVFQSFNLLPTWTASQNIDAALLHGGLTRAARRRRTMALLEQVGLLHRSSSLPGELSVGEQQRVAVARALANDPDVILADEPTGEVDAETAQDVLRCLLSATRPAGRALIVATHGVWPVDHADAAYRLQDGVLSVAGL